MTLLHGPWGARVGSCCTCCFGTLHTPTSWLLRSVSVTKLCGLSVGLVSCWLTGSVPCLDRAHLSAAGVEALLWAVSHGVKLRKWRFWCRGQGGPCRLWMLSEMPSDSNLCLEPWQKCQGRRQKQPLQLLEEGCSL